MINQIFIEGKPYGKGVHRTTTIGGFARTYPAPKDKNYMKLVEQAVERSKSLGRCHPIEGSRKPIEVLIIAYFKRPESHYLKSG